MRNILHFFVMLPVIFVSMIIGAVLIGFSVAVDSLEMESRKKPSKID